MGSNSVEANALNKLRGARRKRVSLESKQLTVAAPLNPGGGIPLRVTPTMSDLRVISWAESKRDWIQEQLLQHAGILLRGFPVNTPEMFQQLLQTVFQKEMLDYQYRSTPRTKVSGKIYTSTEYPPDTPIPLHSESAFASTWPMKIAFFCVTPAATGGETPIADSRAVYRRIDPAIRERFHRKKIRYVRNYADKDLDLSWKETFQTTDRAEVERYCHERGIVPEWKSGNRLRTSQICQGVARHPVTREWVWFNQAHLFHISGLKQEVRESILAEFSREDLPRNAYYGDGSEIETSVIREIRGAFREETVTFPWQRGDVLILDNMLAAHGRRPFSGKRETLVGMVEPFEARILEEE